MPRYSASRSTRRCVSAAGCKRRGTHAINVQRQGFLQEADVGGAAQHAPVAGAPDALARCTLRATQAPPHDAAHVQRSLSRNISRPIDRAVPLRKMAHTCPLQARPRRTYLARFDRQYLANHAATRKRIQQPCANPCSLTGCFFTPSPSYHALRSGPRQ